MHQNPGLKWLFLDLNSYFASVEQQERPKLRGKPVAVVPMRTDSTCAIAASYEAKAYGVKTGTKIYDARRMCPGLQCVLARHDVYVTYHNRIIEEVVRHTPINKIWSIDELSSRLPPLRRTPEKAREVAMNIKRGLWQNIGPAINCSIGVAPNSLLAKIATDMQKPDGLVIIRQEDLPGPLLKLPLTAIPGIGPTMERRLHRAGIRTMEALWNTPPKHMRKIWGSVQGERMWYWLHGYDFDAPETRDNVMIGHSRVLDPNLRAPDKTRLMARQLLTKATQRLRRKGYYASVLSLGLRTTDGQRWRGDLRLPFAQDPFTFLKALDELWAEATTYFCFPRSLSCFPRESGDLFTFAEAPRLHGGSSFLESGLRFRKVSTILSGLKRKHEITENIFDASPATLKQIQKREALTGALDKLQAKYHKETVTLGTPPKTLSGFVGTKIAFSRVPEEEEFWS